MGLNRNIKVVTRILGGLGNQLFAFCAARRLSLANNAELVLDHVSGFKRDSMYQRYYQLDHFHIPCRKATPTEQMEPFSRIRRKWKIIQNQKKPFEQRNYIKQERMDFDSRLLNVKPKGTVYVEGYWQSEEYFKDVSETIRSDLRIIPPKDEVNQAIAEKIENCTAIAVHVRFFDATEQQGINNAPSNYYTNAIEEMKRRVPDAHYYVFSDKPNDARNYIPFADDQITLVAHNQGDENAYADLWLMTKCRHFIIANSTFSWWGAWLGGCKDKIVIAPGFEKREGVSWWGFDGLIPKEWITC